MADESNDNAIDTEIATLEKENVSIGIDLLELEVLLQALINGELPSGEDPAVIKANTEIYIDIINRKLAKNNQEIASLQASKRGTNL